ncbi:MAG: hypothetical protein IKS56_00400 [Lachnospiraceae bacterium]|nr:hypothetical protein [Lachnospiraceae bacterium]
MSNSNSSDAMVALFAGGASIFFIIFMIVYSVVLIGICTLLIVSLWKIFVKAGKPGWACLIPGYNFWVMSEIACNNNIMFFIFIFIPFLNFVALIAFIAGICRTFGKGVGFTILSVFFYLVTFPILAFGKSQYDPSKKLG